MAQRQENVFYTFFVLYLDARKLPGGRMKHPDRGCIGKVQFTTHKQAEQVRLGGYYARPEALHSYRCSKGHWHIGSKQGKHEGGRNVKGVGA